MAPDPADLIGRTSERAAVLAALDGSADGCTAVLLTGEAGIGKTAIWESVVAERRVAGDLVLVSRATAAEARLPWVGLTDLVRGIPTTTLASLPEVQRRLWKSCLCNAVSWHGDGSEALDERTVGTALLSALRAATDSAPVLLAVDDLPYLDPATAAAVTFALRRMEGRHPARLLATARDERSAAASTAGATQRSSLDYPHRSVDSGRAVRSAAGLAAGSGWPGRCCCAFTRRREATPSTR